MIREVQGWHVLSVVRRSSWLAALALATACAPQRSPATAASPTELSVLLYQVSHGCQPPLASTNDAAERTSGLFVETVLLDVPRRTTFDAARISEIAQQPDVRLLGTPHLYGNVGARTTMTLEQHLGVLDHPTLSRVSLLTGSSESRLHVLEFDLGFSLPNADPAHDPKQASTTFLVEGLSERALLGSADKPGDPQRKILAVVKATPIHGTEDLRTLFECKMRLHQQALGQR